jgi:uncharacterized protein YjbI with pentapeptide repeats
VVHPLLRMRYTPPAPTKLGSEQVERTAPPAEDGIPAAHPVPGHDPADEELQVRQTAQRILAAHLRPPLEGPYVAPQRRRPSLRQAFWPGISVNLTGAALVNLDFVWISVMGARFHEASFQGDARFEYADFEGDDAVFSGASFQGRAVFNFANFEGHAEFDGATFQGGAQFDDVRFQYGAGFSGASFQGRAAFKEATFHTGAVGFDRATFQGRAEFDEASFTRSAWFGGVSFQDEARFYGVCFQDHVVFIGANFKDLAWFGNATFGDAAFNEATFQGGIGFDRATFQGRAVFDEVQVLHLDNPDLKRVWPNGYSIRPDPADPTRGTLVRAEKAEEPEPAVPLPSTGSRRTQRHGTDQMQ